MKSKTNPVTDDGRLEPTQKNARLGTKTPAVHAGLGALLARPTAVGIIDGAHRAKPARRRRPRVPGG
jgi:hypothetical protein